MHQKKKEGKRWARCSHTVERVIRFVGTQQPHKATLSYALPRQSTSWQICETACEFLIATWSAGIFWIGALICLCTRVVFKWVCQIPCTPTSLTAWYTGYNVIRRDPEQYVMTLVDGRGCGTGGADRSDWSSVLCVLHIMLEAPNVWCTPSEDVFTHALASTFLLHLR